MIKIIVAILTIPFLVLYIPIAVTHWVLDSFMTVLDDIGEALFRHFDL